MFNILYICSLIVGMTKIEDIVKTCWAQRWKTRGELTSHHPSVVPLIKKKELTWMRASNWTHGLGVWKGGSSANSCPVQACVGEWISAAQVDKLARESWFQTKLSWTTSTNSSFHRLMDGSGFPQCSMNTLKDSFILLSLKMKCVVRLQCFSWSKKNKGDVPSPEVIKLSSLPKSRANVNEHIMHKCPWVFCRRSNVSEFMYLSICYWFLSVISWYCVMTMNQPLSPRLVFPKGGTDKDRLTSSRLKKNKKRSRVAALC